MFSTVSRIIFRRLSHNSSIKHSRLDRDNRVAALRGATQLRIRIKNYLNTTMNQEVEQIIAPLREAVKQQGDLVRSLKEQSAPKSDIDAAVRALKAKKKVLEDKEASLVPKEAFVDKTRLDDVLKRRFFFDSSFSIYGGVAGLFDYGPPGVAIKKNLLRQWEAHFLLEEDLLEIEASQLTLEPVLKASGHVDKFVDLMVKDTKTGDCYRLDHLVKNYLEKLATDKPQQKDAINKTLSQLDGLSQDQLNAILRENNIKAPATGNDLTEPVEFNLMFATNIGPTGLARSFLRPETAQGIFVNFKRLLEANQGRLPFGVAQIGKSFRNEISPRGGLVRMREFTMAEIEYFVDPENKTHRKFESIKDTPLNMLSAANQMNGEKSQTMAIGEAVAQGIVANEVLGYFLARIHLFMVKIGIDPTRMRFRQHMSNEMAHYATDCWDCECFTTNGWLECIGCADRSCYDLNQHAAAANVRLAASRHLKEPKPMEFVECVPQRPVLGKLLKGDAKIVLDELEKASKDKLEQWEKELESGMLKLTIGDKSFELTKDMLNFKRTQKNVMVEEVVPNVIEPSFGIDRIIYTLLEHTFKMREDNQLRTYFSFPPIVAPIKCSVLPLSNNEVFMPFVEEIVSKLKNENVRPKVDASGESIGRRYARTDEIGIPFGITIDFDTVKDRTVTLRSCETTEQIRGDIDMVVSLARDLSSGRIGWKEAREAETNLSK